MLLNRIMQTRRTRALEQHPCGPEIRPGDRPLRSAAPKSRAQHEITALQRFRSRRGQSGNVLIYFVLSLAAVVFFAAYGITIGQVYLAKDQLQVAADVTARATLDVKIAGQSDLASRTAGQFVGERTVTNLEVGTVIDAGDIVFGDWDYSSRTFRAGGTTFSPAVEVTARRTQGSGSGPIALLMVGYIPERYLEIQASSVAAAGCREIVFALDWSTSMEDEIEEAYDLIDGFIDEMEIDALAGDKVGVVIYAGDALSAQEYAANGGQYASGNPDLLSDIPSDRADIDDFVDALRSEGAYCEKMTPMIPPRSPGGIWKIPTLDKGSCLGKGDHHGIYRAIEMFEEFDDDPNSCAADDEKLIIMLTSDTPCFYWGSLVNDWFTRFYGGNFDQAYAAADYADSLDISIQPVLINRGRKGNCPYNGIYAFQHEDRPREFIDKMARGFPTAGLKNPTQNDFNEILERLGERMNVRLVQ